VTVFGDYAGYYDLLYSEKDYESEAAFVYGLLRKHCPHAGRLLELGCGTGAHAQYLARSGLYVHGLDCSPQMLERARTKQQNLPPDVRDRLEFSVGDARNVRLGRCFDGIISLFHVFSYEIRNEDVRRAFVTVKRHLDAGGVFIFDCWYGPAVLAEMPAVRVKHWEDDATKITRIAEPVMYPNENRVDVNYTILIRDRTSGTTKELKEIHQMRYFFRPEVVMFASLAGLEIIDSLGWMTENQPSLGTWNVCFVARA
jgi:SAM-dependent methyltransferase